MPKIIEMIKYGKFLHGREEGHLAYSRLAEIVESIQDLDYLSFDFSDVLVLAPSYCDEVFANLHLKYPGKIKIPANISHAFKVAFETVEETRELKFEYV
ncbi:MAG: hypothetical protein ACKO3R_05190 [bacterium]